MRTNPFLKKSQHKSPMKFLATVALLALVALTPTQRLNAGGTVDLNLTPTTASNPVGTAHTVMAVLTESGSPFPGQTVQFSVVSGPNAGKTGSDVTDVNGHASFT